MLIALLCYAKAQVACVRIAIGYVCSAVSFLTWVLLIETKNDEKHQVTPASIVVFEFEFVSLFEPRARHFCGTSCRAAFALFVQLSRRAR